MDPNTRWFSLVGIVLSLKHKSSPGLPVLVGRKDILFHAVCHSELQFDNLPHMTFSLAWQAKKEKHEWLHGQSLWRLAPKYNTGSAGSHSVTWPWVIVMKTRKCNPGKSYPIFATVFKELLLLWSLLYFIKARMYIFFSLLLTLDYDCTLTLML